jgi:hypothetical protein
MKHQPLSVIAAEIEADWGYKINPYAVESLQAMGTLNSIKDNYFLDSGAMIVGSFLANAAGWRGPVARRIKAELRSM